MPMSVRSVSRSRSAWFAAAFAVAATLLAEPCSAQPPDGHIESSRALYRQAHEEMAQQKWAEARRLLLEIWGEARTHDVAASLGQVEHRLGDPAAGAHYMALAVALAPPREKLETVQRYRAALAELKQKVATVHVTVTAADAELRVDGEPVEPTADSELFLAPGEHTLSIEAILTSSAVQGGGASLEFLEGKELESSPCFPLLTLWKYTVSKKKTAVWRKAGSL